MTEIFRVALSGDFCKADGSPVYPDFDLAPLRQAPGVEMAFLEPLQDIRPEQIKDFDALILLGARFGRQSIHPNGRLGVVARFGVGYDNVDVEACTEAGIALVITPDGVRRPVAVAIITLMLALMGKLMVKDRLTREGPEGFARRSQHMGLGLVGRTLGSIGVGNIGAELFRLAKPFDMRFIAHDPVVDARFAAEPGGQQDERVEIFNLFGADFLRRFEKRHLDTRRLAQRRKIEVGIDRRAVGLAEVARKRHAEDLGHAYTFLAVQTSRSRVIAAASASCSTQTSPE